MFPVGELFFKNEIYNLLSEIDQPEEDILDCLVSEVDFAHNHVSDQEKDNESLGTESIPERVITRS